MAKENKTVLQGTEWHQFLVNNNFKKKLQMEIYNCTHNHEAIYLLNGYYFAFSIPKGYKNLTSLKRLVG